jgi:hypothetical protein
VEADKRDTQYGRKLNLSPDCAAWGRMWSLKKLKRFRAGIEGNISMLMRIFGLDRCTGRGLKYFKAYVMSAVLPCNFKVFAWLARQTLVRAGRIL